MPYLLDANTIIGFFKTKHQDALATLAERIELVVVEEVKGEVHNAPKRWWNASKIDQRAIVLGTAEHATLAALGAPTQKGRGERASIALAAHDPSLLLVTSDRGAALLAQRELHGATGRTLSLAAFLRHAREHGLTWAAVDDVYGESKLPRPSWWAGWRTGTG